VRACACALRAYWGLAREKFLGTGARVSSAQYPSAANLLSVGWEILGIKNVVLDRRESRFHLDS
jgi:hypothetical protein